MAHVWLLIASFFLLLELSTPSLFYFLSFFVGGMATWLLSSIVSLFTHQMGIFCAVSISAFILLQQWIKRIKKVSTYKSNFFALQGKRGVVVRAISVLQPGLVKINGETWSAHSVNNTTIQKDEIVEIVRVQGAYIIVQEVIHQTPERI